MLGYLSDDGSSANVFSSSIGKKIKNLTMENDVLRFEFEDESKIQISDEGQSCCEHRYMTSDDDLQYFVGSTLVGGEIKDAPSIPDEYGDHEVQFLEIKTDRGSFVCQTHNEHNGYYGGFWIQCKQL